MSGDRTNEQVIEFASDGVMFLIEGIGEILGKSNISETEKNSIFSKLQSVMNDFLKNSTAQSYGEIGIEELKKINSEIEHINLAKDHMPQFQELAEKYQLNYSVSNVKTDNETDITVVKFPKSEIDKMTKICMDIAKKSISKSKTPAKDQLAAAKKKSIQKESQKAKQQQKSKTQQLER